MDDDFAGTLARAAAGELGSASLHWKKDPSVCVVMAASGYPGAVRTGDPITGTEENSAQVFHAGTRIGARGLETSGGRVLGVTASGPDLAAAVANAYAGVETIHFDGMHFRRDIASKGLKRWYN
jgi:phosphoribosylamine--glycine ligase